MAEFLLSCLVSFQKRVSGVKESEASFISSRIGSILTLHTPLARLLIRTIASQTLYRSTHAAKAAPTPCLPSFSRSNSLPLRFILVSSH